MLLLLAGALFCGTDPKIGKDWDTGNPLTWKDFKDTTVANTPYLAVTGTTMRYAMNYTDANHVAVDISCFMDYSKSWVLVTAEKTDYLLGHEQYHFNIAEYWARKFRKEISTTRFDSKNVREKLRTIYREMFEQDHAMQTQYDAETHHSKLKDQQKLWQDKIDKLLASVKNYADTGPVTLTLK